MVNPECYTASVTGHPIADVPNELEEYEAIGVRRAAVRRLRMELGIKDVDPDDFYYLTRYYHLDVGNGRWGEHHIIYILFLQRDFKLRPNPHEVSEFSVVPKGYLSEHLATLNAPLTPFFELIFRHRLFLWWDNLDDLDAFKDHERISVIHHNWKNQENLNWRE